MQLNKTHELSYTDGIDVSTIGTGDPRNALEELQDWIIDNRANTDGISDEDQMAYLVFAQDLADDVSKAKEEAEFQAELEALPQGWEYEAYGFGGLVNGGVFDGIECPDCTGGDSLDGSTEGTMLIECGRCMEEVVPIKVS